MKRLQCEHCEAWNADGRHRAEKRRLKLWQTCKRLDSHQMRRFVMVHNCLWLCCCLRCAGNLSIAIRKCVWKIQLKSKIENTKRKSREKHKRSKINMNYLLFYLLCKATSTDPSMAWIRKAWENVGNAGQTNECLFFSWPFSLKCSNHARRHAVEKLIEAVESQANDVPADGHGVPLQRTLSCQSTSTTRSRKDTSFAQSYSDVTSYYTIVVIRLKIIGKWEEAVGRIRIG